MKNGKYNFIFLAVFLFSCTSHSNTQYNVGFFLQKITGKIILQENTQSSAFNKENCMVLILANQNIGIELAEKIYRKKAYIERVTRQGQYNFSTIGKGQIFELSVFCPTYEPQFTQFRQNLGIRSIIYNPELKKDIYWKDNYALQVRFFLNEVLLEKNYGLSEVDEFFLAEWLEKLERNIF